MWEEVLRLRHPCARRGIDRCGSGRRFAVQQPSSGMAGVANIGTDRNWSGSHFDQANWYAFGRLAWDHQLSSRGDRRGMDAHDVHERRCVVAPVVAMMMGSRETVVNYMTPLGLHHIMATGHHYGPGPWVEQSEPRRNGTPSIIIAPTRADIGFDRTATGSNAVAQYAPRSLRVSGISKPFRTNTCCGSIMSLGIVGCARAARCGTNWSCAIRRALTKCARCGALGRV